MKESTKKYLKLSLILYVVILAVAAVGTLAWFQYSREVAPTDEGNIISGKNVDICVNDGNDLWGNEISVERGHQIPDISMTPEGVFYYPRALDENDELLTGDAGKGLYLDVSNENGYFIKVPVKIRSNEPISVYLQNTSFVSGASITETEGYVSTPDAIAGAVRVAFFEVTGGTKTLKTVWVPNDRYQLYGGTGEVNLSGSPDVNGYSYLKVQDNTVKKGDETGTWSDDLLTVGDNELVSCNNSADENEIVYVNDATPILTFDTAGVKELEVYIWIEGTDREAKTVLSGGVISYELNFIGVEDKAVSAVDVAQVAYSNGSFVYNGKDISDSILYSLDGRDWTQYQEGTPHLSDIKYIRVKETESEKLGEVREFTVA